MLEFWPYFFISLMFVHDLLTGLDSLKLKGVNSDTQVVTILHAVLSDRLIRKTTSGP